MEILDHPCSCWIILGNTAPSLVTLDHPWGSWIIYGGAGSSLEMVYHPWSFWVIYGAVGSSVEVLDHPRRFWTISGRCSISSAPQIPSRDKFLQKQAGLFRTGAKGHVPRDVTWERSGDDIPSLFSSMGSSRVIPGGSACTINQQDVLYPWRAEPEDPPEGIPGWETAL